MKRFILLQLCVVVLALTVLEGCGTTYYQGSLGQNTPVEERCLLEIGVGLMLTGTYSENGTVIRYGLITIPSGEHKLYFDYERSSSFTRNSWTYTTTSSARGLVYEGEFIAGHHYYVEPEIFNNNNSVRIKVTDRGANTKAFKNGVYSGFTTSGGYYLAYGGAVPLTVCAGLNPSLTYVHDGSSRWNIHTGIDVDMECGILGVDFGGSLGILTEFFLFNNTSSIAVGTGLKLNTFSPANGIFIPYVRGEFKFPRSGWRLFVNYYFVDLPSSFYYEVADVPKDLGFLLKSWSIGIQYRNGL